MSTLHHEEILETIFEGIQLDFPDLSEDEQIKKTYEVFEELAQWKKDYVLNLHKASMTTYIILCVLKMNN